MKTSLTTIVLIGIIAVVSLTSLPAASQAPPACTEPVLPTTIHELLKAKFPSWRPKQISDMDADDQQLWLKGPHGKECPGSATGHFESTDSLSYALLLVPQSNPGGGHKIVVFSKDPAKDLYTLRLLDQADGQTYSGLVISKARPGKYEDWEGKRSIQVRLDGLYVEWMEKGAQLYYWRAGRYHKLQVSD